MTTIREQQGNVTVWWFPRDFSQSRFGAYQRSGTNSCTLIALLLADKVAKETNGFHGVAGELPKKAVEIFAISMNQGNKVYGRAFSKPSFSIRDGFNLNINIPDAMAALYRQNYIDFHLYEWFFTHLPSDPRKDNYARNISHRLAHVLRQGMNLFKQPRYRPAPQFLFAAIIADSRTVVMSFELRPRLITFFDSHQHGGGMGAVIAQSSFENVLEICTWYINMLRNVFSSTPKLFEVSFLTRDFMSVPQPSVDSYDD